MAALIHHLALASDYAASPSDQPYLPPAYAADGFIHCTQQLTVLAEVATRFYSQVSGDFLVLDIDPRRLTSELRYEPPMPPAPVGSPLHGVLFPHIYGPLNRNAIVTIRLAQRAPDGRFVQV